MVVHLFTPQQRNWAYNYANKMRECGYSVEGPRQTEDGGFVVSATKERPRYGGFRRRRY